MRSKRIELEEEYIKKHKTVSLDQLCQEFNISKNTVRRDIEILIESGTVKKVYGGVTFCEKKQLISFEERNIKSHECKELIAKKAASFINDGDTIFIDSGTTTALIVDFLQDKKDLTVFTNNLQFIIKAMPLDNINLMCLSGKLNRKTCSFTGMDSISILEKYNIGKCFMACTGISLESGITNSSNEEYEIKKTAINRCKERFLLVDSSKFDSVALITYSNLDSIHYVITDETPDERYVNYFKDNNISLQVCEKY